MGFEIERKWTVKELPAVFPGGEKLYELPNKKITQGYLCTQPVVRIRQEGTAYYLTYKGKGFKVREEYNLPLTEEAYRHLLPKCDGIVIEKTRYRLSLNEIDAQQKKLIEDREKIINSEKKDIAGNKSFTEVTKTTTDDKLSDADETYHTDGTEKELGSDDHSEKSLTAEIDLFHGIYEGLILIEVEFPSAADADAFEAPVWFGKEVTEDPAYSNSSLSRSADKKDCIR